MGMEGHAHRIDTETSTNTGKHDPKILTEEIETTHLQNGSNTDHTEQADVEMRCDVYNQTQADMQKVNPEQTGKHGGAHKEDRQADTLTDTEQTDIYEAYNPKTHEAN